MKIFNDILKERNGMYVHAIEVNSAYELECIVEQLYSEFNREYTKKEIIEFFNTIEVYCLSNENENEIYNFNFEYFILENV